MRLLSSQLRTLRSLCSPDNKAGCAASTRGAARGITPTKVTLSGDYWMKPISRHACTAVRRCAEDFSAVECCLPPQPDAVIVYFLQLR